MALIVLTVFWIFVCVVRPGLAQEHVDESQPILDVWYGLQQKVGHLGNVQSDFNLLGHVRNEGNGVSGLTLTYRLNNAAPETLSIGTEYFGDGRRLGARGDFNADIPLHCFEVGRNTITLIVTNSAGISTRKIVRVNRQRSGDYPLPAYIEWAKVEDVQDVGQVVDGKWGIVEEGLRTIQTGYDRIFLIGNENWQDYEVTVPITIHRVDPETGPRSGANGVGILMRFTGHVTGTYREWPDAQPKWGYQPFGAIGWLRWINGPEAPPVQQFYRGDSNETKNFSELTNFAEGQTYWLKMQAKTLPVVSQSTELPDQNQDVTRYRWKLWSEIETEPSVWDWSVTQRSRHALRKGGVVLLAHHVDVTFGDLLIEPLSIATD